MSLKKRAKKKMRKIKTSQIKDKVKELFLKANYHLDQDLMHRLEEALEEETSSGCILRVIDSRSPYCSYRPI